MNILEAVILGIVQGFTEFLPVSSSGHLTLLQAFFGIEEGARLFTIVVHVGTLVPVLWIYRRDLTLLVRSPLQRYTWLLAAATLPAVFAALAFDEALDSLFGNLSLLPFAFAFTGLVLILAERASEGTKKEPSYLDSLMIGLMQAFAIIPGVSRSGSTIFAGLSRGMSREAAAKFSFMLSIPAITGGFVLEIAHFATSTSPEPPVGAAALVFGFFAAMLTGYLAINILLELIRKRGLKIFSAYLFTLSGVLIIFNIF